MNTTQPLPNNNVSTKISPLSAHQACLVLSEKIPQPDALEFMNPIPDKITVGSLLKRSHQSQYLTVPSVLFNQMQLSIADVPEEWLAAYAKWIDRERRTQEFVRNCQLLECKSNHPLPVTDPIIAGLLIYHFSAELGAVKRSELLDLAITDPAGAWLAAEGLNREDEWHAIVAGVKQESRLLWAVSQIPGLRRETARQASQAMSCDLFTGLILAAYSEPGVFERWLLETTLAGVELPEAAAACLALQPEAEPHLIRLWIGTLQKPGAAMQAFQAVQWTQHTWKPKEWDTLKADLKAPAISDRAQGFVHWHRDIEPQSVNAAIGDPDLDLLWAAELLEAVPAADDYALRFQVGCRIEPVGSSAESLMLGWLNQRLLRNRK